MIRVTIDLHVVEETDEAYWLTTMSSDCYESLRSQHIDRFDAMDAAREAFGHVFRRVEKGKDVREFIEEMMLAMPVSSVEQVFQEINLGMEK